jgi:predicted dehydrogenase
VSQQPPEISRRTLLVKGTAAAIATGVLPAALAQTGTPPVVDTGTANGNKVSFPNEDAATEKPAGDPPNPLPGDQRIGFAVIGLGRLALDQILPAFTSCKEARLAALVSGTPDKASAIARQYGLPASSVLSYERFDELAQRKDVQAVYIVLPNALHREWVERAAKIGKHVLCEKPMTVSSADAEAMIAACRAARVKLMIAYRCQYEITNRYLDDQVRAGKLGVIRSIHAINVQNMAATPDGLEQWRFKKSLAGGGSLPDVGLYCLNGSRALLGEEPVEITAQIQTPPNDPRFREVEDVVDFTLHFPSGAVAGCTSSYSAHQLRSLTVAGSDAWARMDKAFDYRGQTLHISRLEGKAESTSELDLGYKNQFSLEIDHMATCIKSGREPRTSGEEGLQDHKLMEAIYDAARTGRAVRLPSIDKLDSTRGPALPPLEL